MSEFSEARSGNDLIGSFRTDHRGCHQPPATRAEYRRRSGKYIPRRQTSPVSEPGRVDLLNAPEGHSRPEVGCPNPRVHLRTPFLSGRSVDSAKMGWEAAPGR